MIGCIFSSLFLAIFIKNIGSATQML